jgi:hypothetical protein
MFVRSCLRYHFPAERAQPLRNRLRRRFRATGFLPVLGGGPPRRRSALRIRQTCRIHVRRADELSAELRTCAAKLSRFDGPISVGAALDELNVLLPALVEGLSPNAGIR